MIFVYMYVITRYNTIQIYYLLHTSHTPTTHIYILFISYAQKYMFELTVLNLLLHLRRRNK